MIIRVLLCVVVLLSVVDGAILKDYRFLSHNVTALLDRLLDKNRYDKRIRPGLGGPPVTVQVNMYIKSIGPVSENDESYGMDCYFRQTWYDKRLAYSFLGFNEFSLSWLILDRVWKPDTYFMNGKKSHLHRITVPNKFLRLRNDGFMTYSMRLTIKADCPMYLRKFPMDSQTCPLYIGSYGYMMRDVMYEWTSLNSSVSIENQELAQYSLNNVTYVNHTIVMRGNDPHSMIRVNFHMKRMTGFFLLQVYVPCGLIVCCSWVSFWIDPDAVPARVSLGVTTVLSMTTMGFGGKSQMPKVSYATALDWFVILCFSFVFAVMIEYAAINFIDKVTKDLKRVIKEKGKKNPSPPPGPQPETVTNPPTPCVSTLDLTKDPEPNTPIDFVDQLPNSPNSTQNFLNAFKRSPLLNRTNRLARRRTLSCISAEVNLNAPTAFVPLIIVTDKDSSNSTSNGREFDQNTVVDLENDHNYASVDDIGDCDDLENASVNESIEKAVPEGLCEIFNACVRIFGYPYRKWKEWRFIPNEDDVSKLMLSDDPPDKFTNIDIQSRKLFPLCFFSLLTIYGVAFSYYLTDDFPIRILTSLRTNTIE